MYEYEKAIMNIYKGVNYAPLMSWDFCSSNLTHTISIAKELNTLKQFEKQNNWIKFPNLQLPLLELKTLVLTNLNKEIVWVSNRFYNMTGYRSSEAIGKKPFFLQGQKTNYDTLKAINSKLNKLEVVTDSVINYRKNGEEYICHLEIHPILNKNNMPINYLAIEFATI